MKKRNDSLALTHTPTPTHSSEEAFLFLRQLHTVTIPGLCGRRLFACVCPPGRLQPLVNKRYRWFEDKREACFKKNKKTNLPFPLHHCVSWDRLYLENRFEPNGSLQKFGSVPGLSVYYTNTFKNNSLAP